MKQRAEKHLEIALGGNMNISTLTPLALVEIMTDFAKKEVEAINYNRCCKSDSEQLPDLEKEKLIEDAYWLNLQNLNGREDFQEAFKLGIEVGVSETLEKLHS